MKRILPVIGTAFLACAAPSALAFESDAVLDQFPGATVSGGRSVHEPRRAARSERAVARHESRRDASHAPRYRSHGSFIEVTALGRSVEPGAFYGTAGTANSGGGIVVIHNGADLASLSAAIHSALGPGAKVLDIEADRLDRRPYGPDGLDVVHTGGAKIIRISPDFGRARAGDDEVASAPAPMPEPIAYIPPATVYPDTDMSERPVDPPAAVERQASIPEPSVEASEPDVEAPPVAASEPEAPRAEEQRAEMQAQTPAAAPPAPAGPPAPPAAYLEPWTPDWLRDCVARHPTFDASLGTYVNASGQRRFCTGEP